MKKLYLLTITALFAITIVNAQSVGINNDGSAPNASAMLDIKNPNKGLLVPRVALTGTTDVNTIPSPATSLLIYNTATAGTGGTAVSPGYYYWSGSAWILFANSAQIVVIPEVVNMTGAYSAGTVYNQNDLVTTDATNAVYYYSLTAGNVGNTPGSSPGSWQAVEVEQLKVIHKTLTSSNFASLMSIFLTGTNTSGGRIYYMIRATDGGAQIATEEGVIQYVATANSITCTVQTTDKLHLGTVNSGCTPGFYNPGSRSGISINDNVTFSSPAPIVDHDVYFHIENTGGQLSGSTYSKIKLRLE